MFSYTVTTDNATGYNIVQLNADYPDRPQDNISIKVAVEGGSNMFSFTAGGLELIDADPDLSKLHMETTDLDEWGAAQIEAGSPATLVFNAFDDKMLTGHVTEIDLRGERLPAGDVVYRAVIELDAPDPDLRWGMTARINFPLE